MIKDSLFDQVFQQEAQRIISFDSSMTTSVDSTLLPPIKRLEVKNIQREGHFLYSKRYLPAEVEVFPNAQTDAKESLLGNTYFNFNSGYFCASDFKDVHADSNSEESI